VYVGYLALLSQWMQQRLLSMVAGLRPKLGQCLDAAPLCKDAHGARLPGLHQVPPAAPHYHMALLLLVLLLVPLLLAGVQAVVWR
jgi:hypothetical protein